MSGTDLSSRVQLPVPLGARKGARRAMMGGRAAILSTHS
ncbi:hypothetical protein AAKU61_004368, partial [Undibacterium sp. GrIS 1.2]